MDEALKVLAVLGAVIGAAGFFMNYFQRKSTADLLIDVALLKKQMALFWGVVEKEIGNMLHSPHREELDKLIEKNNHHMLSQDEIHRFAELLQQLKEDKTASNGERTAAIILRAALLAQQIGVAS